jgi:uncharacterized protein YjiS (DUF1127 family)
MRLLPATSTIRRGMFLIGLWWRRSSDRQMLMMMNDRELRDIGITRYDVLYEARKPFWRE